MSYYVLRSRLPSAPDTYDYVGRVLNRRGVISVEFVALAEHAQRFHGRDLAETTAEFLLDEKLGPFDVRRVDGE